MTIHINLLSNKARVNGVYRPATDLLYGNPVRDNYGRLVIDRPSANQLPNPALAGIHFGTLGSSVSGGALPTGYARTNTIPMDILPAPAGKFRHRVYRYAGTPVTGAPQISATPTGSSPGVTPTDISRGGIASSGFWKIITASTNLTWVQITLAVYLNGVLQARSDAKIYASTPNQNVKLWVPVTSLSETVHLWWSPTVDQSSPTRTTDSFDILMETEALQLESASGADDTTSFMVDPRTSPQTCSIKLGGPSSVLLQGPDGGTWIDEAGDLVIPATKSKVIDQIHARHLLSTPQKNAMVDRVNPPIWDHSPINMEQRSLGQDAIQIQRAPNPWCFGIANNRTGMMRVEIRAGDRWPGDDEHVPYNSNQRTEVRTYRIMPVNGDVYLYMSLMIEPGPPLVGPFAIMGQMFTNGDYDPNTGLDEAHPPTFTQQLMQGDIFKVFARGDSSPITVSNPPQKATWIQPNFRRGVWHNILHRMTFSSSGGGYLKTWHNGVVVFDAATPLGFNNNQGCYFKYGIYRGMGPDTLATVYTNVLHGTEDLSALATNPLPIT